MAKKQKSRVTASPHPEWTGYVIRMIEAFKIVDLPQVLTNGGPGTATESLTLHSFIAWRTLDIGSSAAVAYILLLLVTVLSIAFVNLVRSRVTDAIRRGT
ncbi:MAG: hypothetical protein AAF639_01450 [Chloroflexota bacterium]